MTPAEWRVLEAYVRARQHDLELDHWHLTVNRSGPPHEHLEADAATWISNDSDDAVLHLSPSFRSWPRTRQRTVILHELLHLSTQRLLQHIDTALTAQEVPGAATVLALTRSEGERTVERIASAIAPRYPLIAWPRGR